MHEINNDLFSGIITALITPIKNGLIDYIALEKLVLRQKAAGIKSLVVGGSTGEGTLLSSKQYFDLIAATIDYAGGTVNIIAGLTPVNTQEAIMRVKSLNKLAIKAIMCAPPPYIRPEQEGLVKHFTELDQVTKVPLMLYIVPSRTNCNFTDQTILAIMALKNFWAIKDASGDYTKPLRILPHMKINLLAGDDAELLAYLVNGGLGGVSVISNLFPQLMNHIYTLYQQQEIASIQLLYQKLLPLLQAISSVSNPIGIKYAMYKSGYIADELILPLMSARVEIRERIDSSLASISSLEQY